MPTKLGSYSICPDCGAQVLGGLYNRHCETCAYGPSKMVCGLAGAIMSNEYIREGAVIVGCVHWTPKPRELKT